MDIRHLRYIVASARNGSFSAAAHELNVRQPIVSKRIKELEDELGHVALFDRSTAGARLTPAGEEFVISARRIIEDVDRLAERARARGAGRLGRVVVGFYKSLSTGGFRAALRDFRKRYPEIDVELVETPFVDLVGGLMSEAIDVAIILGDADKCEVLDSIALWSDQLVVALPEDHRLANKQVIYWPELKRERFLISYHDPGPDLRMMLLRYLAAPSDHPEIVTRRLNRESLLIEVADGQGIALQCESAIGLSGLGVVFRPVHDGNGRDTPELRCMLEAGQHQSGPENLPRRFEPTELIRFMASTKEPICLARRIFPVFFRFPTTRCDIANNPVARSQFLPFLIVPVAIRPSRGWPEAGRHAGTSP